MAGFYLSMVDSELIALALSRLAEALAFEVSAGKARQQPLRSPEYERALEWINGGGAFGEGLLQRLGAKPMQLPPRWEPLVKDVKDAVAVDTAGGGAATGESVSSPP